jgi:uncharacterized protein (TIGR02186 family)
MKLLRVIRVMMTLTVSLAAVAPAAAERLVISLSTHRVLITSSFNGFDLVLFGTVERDAQTVARRGGYDVVVKITGPAQEVVTRRKERVLGIWVNVESKTFDKAPGYIAVLANRPLAAIASPNILRKFEVGLDHTLLTSDGSDIAPDDPFRAAFLRLNVTHGLYREETNAVTFLTPNLFRTGIELPASVPTGNYEVDVKLFADGALLTRQPSAIEIVKVGFEQFVASAAKDHDISYGLVTATMALLTGWLAAVVFRRD